MAKRPGLPVAQGIVLELSRSPCLARLPHTAPKRRPSRKPKTAKPKPPPRRPSTIRSPSGNCSTAPPSNCARKSPSSRATRRLRQQMADLAIRSAVGAERALAIGDASAVRFLPPAVPRAVPRHALAPRAHGRARAAARPSTPRAWSRCTAISSRPSVEAACRHFDAALAKGYAGAKFRLSQCLEKTIRRAPRSLMREAADSGHPAAAETGRAAPASKPDRRRRAVRLGPPHRGGGRRPALGAERARVDVRAGPGRQGADPARAARLYLQAARAGDAAAQNNVGELYETGRGVDGTTRSRRSTGTARRPRRASPPPSSTWGGCMPRERGCRRTTPKRASGWSRPSVAAWRQPASSWTGWKRIRANELCPVEYVVGRYI